MARDTQDATPIADRAALIEYIAKGEKPADQFRIGTEHEKFAFNLDDLSPVPYGGPRGIGEILTRMQAVTGWEPITEHGNIIGLAGPDGGGAISIEPGGQFELSGGLLQTLHETCVEANAHLAQLRPIAGDLGLGFLGLGVAPTWTRADMPKMPKQRYDIMTAYMPQKGNYGLDMMYRTTTIQVNLDFSSEADMVKKMRTSLALQPIATALFANSPFLECQPNGYKSFRARVWQDLDPDRTGPLPFAFEDGFGYERYVDYVMGVPMYFVKRGDAYIDATTHTFNDFWDGRFDTLPGERPNMGDWINHLSTVFPEVRLKRFLEMRGADGGEWRRICALPALWVGLLYDDGVLDQAYTLAMEFSAADRHALWADVPREGFAAKAGGRTVQDIARDVVALAEEGLKRRAHMNGDFDERVFLAPLEDAVQTGRTPADELLTAYNGPWSGDITKVFSANAF